LNNKKLGIILISASVLLGVFLLGSMSNLSAKGNELGCYNNAECNQVAGALGTSHFIIGILAALFSLGIYMFVFNKSEEAILKRLEDKNKEEIELDKFNSVLKILDENEQKVLKAVSEKEGISQSNLRFRTNLSKAKISQIVTNFEKKGIVKRESQGKTYAIYLAKSF